ncbi:hypothetical protein CAL27_08595 [Bordetella genomosp. 1]|uniref:DUF2325 domain-containing protein n=2 Tax=Bordetella genomosp. 1 TaxID=1395607 RepID=A0ABX4EZD6_9BORD|nr:DUF2325 domain-containing protein [Bordetella genomosp. 1]OZI65117.1 hypothetical protein CAL27_08595 [Bordetella genomosp. 1]
MSNADDHHQLKREHAALLASYGRAQARCSAMLREQACRIDALQAEAMQLRAELIIRDTRLAWAGEERQALEAAVPGLARRVTLARQVEHLAGRVQSLLRARQGPMPPAPAHVSAPVPAPVPTAGPEAAPGRAGAAGRAVLCIGREDATTTLARTLVEMTGARFLAIDGAALGDAAEAVTQDTANAALEAQLGAADLVICQTGCVSHGAFWRVQDHCKRHNKQCLLVDAPAALEGVSQVVHLHRGARVETE